MILRDATGDACAVSRMRREGEAARGLSKNAWWKKSSENDNS